MAKRRYGFDEQKIERFHKEGRGLGELDKYKPWLTIQDVSSHGLASRIPGWKSGRIHHLLSNIESDFFLLLDWSERVTDIREQFPLDRESTRRIASELGIRHPEDPGSRVDIVMTTDFVIDALVGGQIRRYARAVKPADQLDDGRVLEKLELERRYWRQQGVDWGIVTERELPAIFIKNIRWLHDARFLEHLAVEHPDRFEDRCRQLLRALTGTAGVSVKNFCRRLEETYGFTPGEPLLVMRHLLANKRLAIDMNRPFAVSGPLSQLWLAETAMPDRVSA